MDKKIIKIPVSNEQREKNEKGKGYVPCQLSGRYLKMKTKPGILFIDVMTSDTNSGEDKLLSRLAVKKQDFIKALNEIEV